MPMSASSPYPNLRDEDERRNHRGMLQESIGLKGALHWQLRTATNLVKSRRAPGQPDDAQDLPGLLCHRLSEGFATLHLRQARALLQQPT
jgi:hypothetical protein